MIVRIFDNDFPFVLPDWSYGIIPARSSVLFLMLLKISVLVKRVFQIILRNKMGQWSITAFSTEKAPT